MRDRNAHFVRIVKDFTSLRRLTVAMLEAIRSASSYCSPDINIIGFIMSRIPSLSQILRAPDQRHMFAIPTYNSGKNVTPAFFGAEQLDWFEQEILLNYQDERKKYWVRVKARRNMTRERRRKTETGKLEGQQHEGTEESTPVIEVLRINCWQ